MVNKNVRDLLDELCENSIVYESPSFDNSIIGVSTEGSVCYSLSKMIKEFAQENKCSEEEALEFIDYNTLNAYCSSGVMPTVVDDTLFVDEDFSEGSK